MNQPAQLALPLTLPESIARTGRARSATAAQTGMGRATPLSRARSADPETSKEAARQAESFVEDQETKILKAITVAGDRGACSKEIARVIGLTHVQVDRRLHAIPGIERRLRKDATGPKDYERREGCACWWAK